MKKHLLLLLSLLPLCKLAGQAANTDGFLYGIISSLDSGAHISFLFGTLHHLDGAYLLNEHLQLATGAEVMVGEADKEASKEYHGRDWTKERSGTSLKYLLNADDFQYVSAEFEKGIGPLYP